MRRGCRNKCAISCAGLLLGALAWLPAHASGAEPQRELLETLSDELAYSMDHLTARDGTRPYYIAYTVIDQQNVDLMASLGALFTDEASRSRDLDTDVRVGGYERDSTHQLRGGADDESDCSAETTTLSLTDEPAAIRHALWLATDRKFKAAVKRFEQVKTNLKTKVEEGDKSGDFARETPEVFVEPAVKLEIDAAAWAERLRRISALARDYPLIYDSWVWLQAQAVNQYMVTSEGTRLLFTQRYLTLTVDASTKAADGMALEQSFSFDVRCEANLPSEQEVADAFKRVITQVLALREAPLAEPYVGPAILMNRASAVLMHEIFGHRIEGHRQRDVEEGQTFAKKVGQLVLPDFLTVRDDATLTQFAGKDLWGAYKYDEEGIAPVNVKLVENGVLKTFLMSRLPLDGCAHSNGHGRRAPGQDCVARQGNLITESSNTVTFAELKRRLVEECKRQEKSYGLLFDDVEGGSTGTQRWDPQAFDVQPILVYRVYADGRGDELVRGVDIVGTPLTCLAKIVCSGDDPAVFNGQCGAESGSVPVSSISPSILVSQIEVEAQVCDQDRPPLLTPPTASQPARLNPKP